MNKFLVFYKSDGLKSAIQLSIKKIASVFYHCSHTKCIYLERTKLKPLSKPQWDSYDAVLISKPEDIATLSFDRLKLLPCMKWLNNGSNVIVLLKGSTPVAFGWTHFESHSIENVGTFDMGNNIAWLGPFFVHKDFRGKGLQKLIIQQCINKVPDNITSFITSTNSKNTASLSSFLTLGFKEGIDIITKSGVFCKKGKEIKEITKTSGNYLKLQQ